MEQALVRISFVTRADPPLPPFCNNSSTNTAAKTTTTPGSLIVFCLFTCGCKTQVKVP